MNSLWLPQNPGIGGLEEITDLEAITIQNISGLGDPGADRILFWDESSNAYAHLTVGSGLTITGTTITAAAGSGDVAKVGTPVNNQVGVWTGDGTLEGDAALTFDTTTDVLSSGGILLSGLTASELTATDASKNIVSLSVATYPSLTELTYVKGVTSAVQTQMNLKAPLASPALTGNPTAPTQTQSDNSTKIATTAYVDNAILQTNYKEAVKYGSTAALPTVVYDNGSSGVGATLTGVDLAALSLDGASPAVGNRVLIKNQVSDFQNGIYTVTATGSGIAVFVLTRTTDFNQSTDILTGDTVFITAGTILANTLWAYTGIDAPTMGTTALPFVQVSADLITGQSVILSGTNTRILYNNNGVLGEYTLTGSGTVVAMQTAPTFNTSITTDYLTASEMVISDGSKKIVSAPVATYPSLTELTYVKGLTSSAQTQLTARLPLAGGTMTGNIVLGENTSIDLDPAGSADGKYTGICITGTAGAALSFGQLCYLAVADSRWELADADAAATAAGVMLGFCVLAAAGDGSATKMLLQGTIRADAQFPALTVGAVVYVGETAGAIQVAIPTGADNVIRPVGFALTADELYVSISPNSQITVA